MVLSSFARHPTISSARLLTHGTQFGEKNEASGDDGTVPQSAILDPQLKALAISTLQPKSRSRKVRFYNRLKRKDLSNVSQ